MEDLRNPDIILDEETHTYRLLSRPDTEFQSCTEFVGSFFEPFRRGQTARKLVKMQKYADRTVGSFLAEWRRRKEEGIAIHQEIERSLSAKVQPRLRRAKLALTWLEEHLPPFKYDYLPELIVFSAELGLAGTIDLLARNRDDESDVVVVDWKATKKIDRSPHQGKRGIRGPARQRGDCRYVKYGIQLSLYSYLLKVSLGVRPRSQVIAHLKHGGVDPILCDYDEDTVRALLEYDDLI